jgi:hypothetical protein
MSAWSARRYLFVLGHMRSYSSLLCHILGSHPQIDGYCETHIKYRTRLDLLRLRSRVVKLTGEPLRGRYVLEKMLHNYAFAPSILRSPRTFALVLVRQPIPAVQSIVNMGLHYGAVAWHRDLDTVHSSDSPTSCGVVSCSWRPRHCFRERVTFCTALVGCWI